MLIYLICYDLEDDRLRDRAAKHLLRHGQRVQESVYEVWLRTPAQFMRFQRELVQILPKSAKLRWYRLTDAGLADSGAADGNTPRKPPAALIC